MSSEGAIRRASLEDAPAINALVASAYRGEAARAGWTHEADLLGGQRTDEALLREAIADPAQAILLLERSADCLACVNLTNKGQGVAYLGMLSVRPDLQAAGLGKRMLGAAEAFARDTFRARTIEMSVIRQRGELIAYYQRRGYALTGDTAPFPYGEARFGAPQRQDLEFLIMAKALG